MKENSEYRKQLIDEAYKNEINENQRLINVSCVVMMGFAVAMYNKVPYTIHGTLLLLFAYLLFYKYKCYHVTDDIYRYDLENAFRTAARDGDKEELIKLLPKLKLENIDVPSPSNGKTPLHWAARYQQSETVEFLLANGANINKQDKDGNTPVHEALNFSKVKPLNKFSTLMAIFAPKTEMPNKIKFDFTLKNNANHTVQELLLEQKEDSNAFNTAMQLLNSCSKQ